MQNQLSLSAYVKRRNGVPLGAKRSMRNMLRRAFGAGAFPIFWHYWNPIWGFYLSRYVMKPLCRYLPPWLAVLMTFAVSGALHDLAVSLVKWQWTFVFTPWFLLMGVGVVLSKYYAVSYDAYPWLVRAALNLLMIAATLSLSIAVTGMAR